MHLNLIFRFIGILIIFLGVSMAAPLVVSIIYGDGASLGILYSLLATSFIGILLMIGTKKDPKTHLNHRDGVAVVTFSWVAAGLIGAVPFLLTNSISGFTDAYFEAMSGFTTTGATIFSDIERLPPSIIMWRSITQWFGGMGIIVLSIAILPFLGIGGMQLYKAEVPSPVVDKLKPRISDTAKALWKVYLLISIGEIIFLFGGGMSLFDAINHTFCTMPTGGFSPKNSSIAYYNSPYFDGIVIFFMLFAGINFSLHYKFLKGDFVIFGKDPECRFFLVLIGIFIIVVTWNIYGTVYDSLATAFRYAAFQVASIITTTGFATADYETWPVLSQNLLVLCMFLGGMAGSTGGGIKTLRVILLVKHSYKEIFRIIHPHAITTVKMGSKPISSEILGGIWGFFILYLVFFVTAAMIMAFIGLDMVSSFTSVAACIFNVGPGLGIVGPVNNYQLVPIIGKWVLIFCMLLGRLEIYTVIVLLVPEYWRK